MQLSLQSGSTQKYFGKHRMALRMLNTVLDLTEEVCPYLETDGTYTHTHVHVLRQEIAGVFPKFYRIGTITPHEKEKQAAKVCKKRNAVMTKILTFIEGERLYLVTRRRYDYFVPTTFPPVRFGWFISPGCDIGRPVHIHSNANQVRREISIPAR